MPPAGTLAGVTFRPAHTGDLYDLHRVCYPHLTRVYVRSRLQYSVREQSRGRRLHLLATLAGEALVGTGQLIGYTDSRAEIANLVIGESYRSHGLGTALITVLTQVADYAGFQKLEIGVLLENKRALDLYRRLQFIDRKRVLLPGQGEIVVLEKLLRKGNG